MKKPLYIRQGRRFVKLGFDYDTENANSIRLNNVGKYFNKDGSFTDEITEYTIGKCFAVIDGKCVVVTTETSDIPDITHEEAEKYISRLNTNSKIKGAEFIIPTADLIFTAHFKQKDFCNFTKSRTWGPLYWTDTECVDKTPYKSWILSAAEADYSFIRTYRGDRFGRYILRPFILVS